MRLLVTSITLLKKLGTRLVNLAIAVPAGQRSQFETAVQLVQCMVDEHENRKLVADGEVLMVGYADDCWSLEKYDEAVRKRWAADANDPKLLKKAIIDFQNGPVLKTLLRHPAGTTFSGGSSSSSGGGGGKKHELSTALGGPPRVSSNASGPASARGGRGSGKNKAKKSFGGGGGPVASE